MGMRHNAGPVAAVAGGGHAGAKERGVLCDTAHSLTVTLLALLPAAYLLVFELDDGYPGGDPAMYLLCVLPLLLLPFAVGARGWADHGGAALRWFLRAATRYALRFLTPTILLLDAACLAVRAAYGGTWTSSESLLTLFGLSALVIGGPVVLALLMVAPWAARGRDARCALAVLANLFPLFLLMIGGIPAVLVIMVNLVFTCRLTAPRAA
ncbi:hypothetical protein ACIPYS_09165 [Kitasatospora sp. NPDC089913]|uniref:hypothetical protein n=1 Tax=Kitasatospora sp. NPDC089913 TaxID=3364080 RepID=UPI003810FB87